MTAEGAIVMEGTDSQKHTSLRYLRLRNDFRNMIKSGMDAYDEQTFINTFQEEAERRHLKHIYQLIRKQMEAVVEVAAVEVEAACDEVGLQQQLEELEALILQRGLLSTETGLPASSNLPLAAEAAARLAAKQAEKKQLQETLQELLKQQAAVQAELEQKQQQAIDLLRDFRDVEDQVDKVYKAGKKWMQRVDGQQKVPMEH